MQDVAEQVDVSLGFVRKVVQIYNIYGVVVDPLCVRSGRPPIIWIDHSLTGRAYWRLIHHSTSTRYRQRYKMCMGHRSRHQPA
jgi:hypothetical protein